MILLNGYSNPKERLVVKLRKEGMTYRQIAKEAQISPRDIKLILVKYRVDDIAGYPDNDVNADPDSLMSISSRAYELFEEFKTPLEVARTLNLRAPEVIRYYDEFLQMNNRGTLVKLFKEIENDGISWLVQLCAVARTKKMSISQVIECVSIYGDLPMLKQLSEDASIDLEAAQNQVFQCENRVEYLNHLTEKLSDDVKFKQIECEKIDESRRKILELTLRLRGVLSEFKDNNNRTYRKIEEFVEDTVDRILREGDNMKLLEFALISVLRSLPQKDQYKYRYLLHRLDLVEVSGSFDSTASMHTTNTYSQTGSDPIVVRNNNPMPYSQNTSNHYQHSYLTKQDDHCPACYDREILATSKKYFESLRKLIIDEIMTTISKEDIRAL